MDYQPPKESINYRAGKLPLWLRLFVTVGWTAFIALFILGPGKMVGTAIFGPLIVWVYVLVWTSNWGVTINWEKGMIERQEAFLMFFQRQLEVPTDQVRRIIVSVMREGGWEKVVRILTGTFRIGYNYAVEAENEDGQRFLLLETADHKQALEVAGKLCQLFAAPIADRTSLSERGSRDHDSASFGPWLGIGRKLELRPLRGAVFLLLFAAVLMFQAHFGGRWALGTYAAGPTTMPSPITPEEKADIEYGVELVQRLKGSQRNSPATQPGTATSQTEGDRGRYLK